MLSCAATESPDVILIVVDTLRADHLAPYGYNVQTAPHVSGLAEQGVVYEAVVAPSSWTKTSMASIWTSRNPLRHGVMRKESVLPAELSTLAGAFRDAGFQTIGINSNPWLLTKYGFSAGFGSYESARKRRGFVDWKQVTAQAVESMQAASRDEPAFLYVHYMDVHPPYSSRSDPPTDPVHVEGRGKLVDSRLEYLYRKKGLEGPGVEQRVLALYDAGIREADAAIASLLGQLDALGRNRERIVAVTSDHGEAFREHGTTEHGRNLYPEVYRVPLILLGSPGLEPGTRIPHQMRSIDIAPTLLSLVGAPVPDSFDGEPLPLAPGPEVADRTAVSSVGFGAYVPESHFVAVVSPRYLYIHERVSGVAEFYDLHGDPGALRDLGGDHADAERFAEIERSLVLQETEQRQLDPDTADALRSLGYLE